MGQYLDWMIKTTSPVRGRWRLTALRCDSLKDPASLTDTVWSKNA